uniref:NAD(P)H oxidase NOX1 n=1 Tax=Asparagopsis taxiformis TaxID=260499 RepID=A0A6M8PU41_9FLOR|nr:NAD(P)H oxidase NOX1 [Asparagopsis taxiformis]
MTAVRSCFKRALSRIEPALQHDGVAYTFIFVHVLINVIVFFVGAAPAWQKKSQLSFTLRASGTLARAGGALLNLNSALVILVAARSTMTYLRRTILNMIVPFDKAMPAFHILCGNALVLALVLHAGGHTVTYCTTHLSGPGFLGPTSLAISGAILTTVLVAMRVTALKRVRKRSFESFYWVHSIGSVAYFILLFMHGSHEGVPKTWMYITGPVVLYILDRLIRLLREKGSRLALAPDCAVLKGPDMVRLSIPRTFSYLAGQYCDIKVPLVSDLEWHPFTIASSPHESRMLFYIKVNGDWTRKLYALFKDRNLDHDEVMIHVRGPYGAPAQHVGQYEHVVLISGGVGATPFASITKYAHHWILNYTQRGAEASKTVSAAFTRNQSVRGTPSVPGTPTVPSGYSSTAQRSRDASRRMSRNQSYNFPHNMSRTRSRNGSRPISRSGSGNLERINSGTMLKSHSSSRTNDSVGIIIQEQRANQPTPPMHRDHSDRMSDGPVALIQDGASASGSAMRPHGMALEVPGVGQLSTDSVMQRFLDEEDIPVPDDYEADLGNPEAPIPDRRAPTMETSTSKPHMFEIIREYDSSKELLDDSDNENESGDILPSKRDISSGDFVGNGELDEGFELDGIDLESGGLELEDQILREQQTASNAYNMLGMSFGAHALMRHMHAQDAKKLRSSMVRASMNLMDDAMDATNWQERLLFYLHTVTVNWVLLWIMLVRFSLVAIGNVTSRFDIDEMGLGIYSMNALNIVDLVLGTLITGPVIGAIVMEVYMNGLSIFLGDNLGNSFDLFVLVPLLMACVVLHVLNLADVGEQIPHISKLTVFVIWPVLSLFLLWRIGRTIGSRVALAQYLKATHAKTKSLDYIWVSKTYEDDSWLIEELLPLAESNIVRLHRFITRHGPKTEPWMLDYEKIPLKTTYSRPDWDDVFGGIVERSKSGTVIGVFFCGPDKMARMIQQAAMKAMAKSVENAYQRGYLQKRGLGGSEEPAMTTARGTAAGDANSRDPAAYGCSVRISVRIENFT